jgi:predicted Zn-dependent protease with MMP-like domain
MRVSASAQTAEVFFILHSHLFILPQAAMTFAEFEARAREMFDSIPPEFREGVDGLVVEPGTQPHPELPGIWTLGECVTEQYPSEFGGPGEVRSFVVLHHGSFRRVAEREEGWDWEGELWETITHEIKHHLESLASEDALEVEDWVMDQNFARREGERFDPGFFRDGVALAEGVWEVDGDVFVEREVERDLPSGSTMEVEWAGVRVRCALPVDLADVHFVVLDPSEADEERWPVPGDLVLVLERRRGAWASIREALLGGAPEVRQSFVPGEVIE